MAAVGAGVLAAGVYESREHRRALAAISLRVHVNGTRGKSSTTKTITALFRALGKTAVGKCTGTAPIVIDPDGTERLLVRRGRTRVHEQVRFLREAARRGADVAVVECMAVAPKLQWICEHRFVQSHIGVITNVRHDHFEEMGRTLDDIARCLANTIPRNGILVTADERFAPLFSDVAASLGTRVVVVGADEVGRAEALLAAKLDGNEDGFAGEVEEALTTAVRKLHAANVAIACRVAIEAGFAEGDVWDAARMLPRPRAKVAPLGDSKRVLVHLWSVNDIDSFQQLYRAVPNGTTVALYNHRSDRPLRALAFGWLVAQDARFRRVLVTGDAGGQQLLLRAGVPENKLQTLVGPVTVEAVRDAVLDLGDSVVVLGCGNARGVEELELGRGVGQ